MFTIKVDGVPLLAKRMFVSVLPQFVRTLAGGLIPSTMGARSIVEEDEFEFSSNGTVRLKRNNAECLAAIAAVHSNGDLYLM